MFHAESNESGQVLTIRYSERVEPQEVQRSLEEVRNLLPGLTPGFSVLTDLTKLESMDISCAPLLGKIMDLCREAGAKTIVRVVPDPQKDIGFRLLSPFHYGPDVRIITHDNLADALVSVAS